MFEAGGLNFLFANLGPQQTRPSPNKYGPRSYAMRLFGVSCFDIISKWHNTVDFELFIVNFFMSVVQFYFNFFYINMRF